MTQSTLIRLKDVQARTGLARSSIYYLIEKDEFPKQIKLSRRMVGWLESDIEAWITKKIEEHTDER